MLSTNIFFDNRGNMALSALALPYTRSPITTLQKFNTKLYYNKLLFINYLGNFIEYPQGKTYKKNSRFVHK